MVARYRRQEALPESGPAIGTELMDGLETVPAHSHDFIEIVLVADGRAWHETRSGGRTVRRGYCAVLRPGEWHSWSHCHDLQVWNVYVGPEVFRHEVGWLRDTEPGSRLITPSLPGRVTERLVHETALARVVHWLGAMPPRHAPAQVDIAARRVGVLSAVLGEIAAAPDLGTTTSQPSTGAHLNPTIAAAIRLLESDVSHPWTVAELAERTHLSTAHLTRLFSHATGMAPITYLARLRAEHVAADLIDGADPISEIGRRYGWADPNYLSRRFRHFFGVSPRVFRNRYSTPRDHPPA